ncbi:type II toxin-antitoxin system RelE/ParE family toxin [Herbivorax sp. ANBcel31]|uniref:type II toxin-antitoxin system RelE/ParE family toxin n=1 Tax=Herbivorax sp. ANBcel31 TaxID=3069754 RepID=UPI0027B23C86|nr:type II toxin-antitoxin system RelE/ParE family toxin [Herbivorax sp. ANBcel31]MDQ2088267.1 type II toxin-antitoxin system RelE/ParE family toxin [Herbivorax sp. ANBcel31]
MVRWSNTSKLDLRQIYDYIAKDSVYYAKKVVNDIIDKSEYLELFPNIGRKVEEINDNDLNEIIIYSYRMIYKVVEDGINVLAIVHCRQNLKSEMLDNEK